MSTVGCKQPDVSPCSHRHPFLRVHSTNSGGCLAWWGWNWGWRGGIGGGGDFLASKWFHAVSVSLLANVHMTQRLHGSQCKHGTFEHWRVAVLRKASLKYRNVKNGSCQVWWIKLEKLFCALAAWVQTWSPNLSDLGPCLPGSLGMSGRDSSNMQESLYTTLYFHP